MKTIKNCDTYYFKPNITLETIILEKSNRYLYIYNYKGNHFRLFTELLELIQFFETGTEPKYDFIDEADLDLFLENYLKDSQ